MPIPFELILEQAPVSSQTRRQAEIPRVATRFGKVRQTGMGYGGTCCRSGIGHNHLLL